MLGIKLPFLLDVWNKILLFIPLFILIMTIPFGLGPFSFNYTARAVILSALLFIVAFIGGYRGPSSEWEAEQAWYRIDIMLNFSSPTIFSVFMANQYYAPQIPNAPATIYLLVLLFLIPQSALSYGGLILGKRLFIRHYPELAYCIEPPKDDFESPAENKQ